MKNWISPDDNEFYVGYFPKAPRQIASATKRVIVILFMVMIAVIAITALEQKEFSSANFEYGLLTTVDGYLFTKPVPHLQVPLGKDMWNKELYQTVLLVGFGKAGADNFILSHRPLKVEGTNVRLTGSLIYGDGKTLLQVEEASDLEYLEGNLAASAGRADQEKISVSGEIVDPKCFFGVMKPGEGKTHRSCAIRCIAGGIPPVFKTDSSGYFLLVNENHEPVSSEIVNIVGDQIVLEGITMSFNDWRLLQIDSELIRKLSANKKWKERVIAFETGVTMCK
ncbi:MAG TPA: hypothetical protein VFG46_30335 [Chryseolinea sp.]|nr:hypothetical protein [Chryseolinea sp.]